MDTSKATCTYKHIHVAAAVLIFLRLASDFHFQILNMQFSRHEVTRREQSFQIISCGGNLGSIFLKCNELCINICYLRLLCMGSFAFAKSEETENDNLNVGC